MPTLHWLWIRLLAGCPHGRIAWALLTALGYARWIVSISERRIVKQHFSSLATIARSAGLEGPLTTKSPAAVTRNFYIHRPILGAAPALTATASARLLNTFVTCDGFDALQAAAAEGRGMVIAGTHFGSLGITPAFLARNGFRVLVLRDQQFARLLNTRHADQFFLGAEPLFLDVNNPDSVSSTLLRCARALREGAVIAYTVDGRHGARHCEGSIFGVGVEVRTALVELAMRCNSPVLHAFSYAMGNRVQVKMSEIYHIKSESDMETWCRNFCLSWQQMILDHPESLSWHKTDVELVKAGNYSS